MRHIAVGLILALATSAAAQDKRSEDKVARQEIEAKLKNLRMTLDFSNASLKDIADYIREISGLNIFVSAKVEEKGEGITIKVQDLALKSILSLVLKPRGLAYTVRDGVLMLTTQDDVNSDVIMEIHDVRDLLYVIPDFPGVDIQLAVAGGGFDIVDQGPTSEGSALPLEELVKAHTGGKSWEDNPKASISLQNGLLVVKQTREVHLQIRRLIGQLRQYK